MNQYLRKVINKYAGFDLYSILIKFTKFGTVGLSGVVINLSIFHLAFNTYDIGLNFSSILAFLVASINNYLWGYFWAFSSPTANLTLSFRNYLKYISFSIFGLMVNLFILNIIILVAGMEFYLLAQLLGIITAAFFNFIVFSIYVFKEDKIDEELSKKNYKLKA